MVVLRKRMQLGKLQGSKLGFYNSGFLIQGWADNWLSEHLNPGKKQARILWCCSFADPKVEAASGGHRKTVLER